ncbi:hypothetical protein [Mycolicibacterium psychrotolerans]|uniref:Uncharacterized protein n=1 Tax=Mycolicibacterium psychrotolerans TaxID=216929 RepID=A0A7I7M9Z2_9MYCO|nr:hypothetical protein [Mycolicibacterium psychrotolerans]BBX69004.1 hypothetical protein MPSYJ_24650 [Mycolicibacterium psychrotolerans]
MPAEARAYGAHQTFQSALLLALTEGRRADRATQFSEQTWHFIDAVAGAHPDATAALISAAYDSFERDCDEALRNMAEW